MKTIFLVIAMALVTFSCKKENKDLTVADIKISDQNLVIKYGTACGMGADSLIFSGNDLWSVFHTYSTDKIIVQHATIASNEKEALLNSLNYPKFSVLDLNSCNACLDGCDSWISVQEGASYHKIRYGYGDSASITTIVALVHELDVLKSKFLTQ